MAGSSVMNAVYNNFLTTYMPHGVTARRDTHKRSELRGIYNSIVRLSKDSPLYLLDTSKEAQAYAVHIKEGARGFRNTVASLGGTGEKDVLNSKTAYSSDSSVVDAKYIGTPEEAASMPSYEIEVQALAQPRTNSGYYLAANGRALTPDTYSFDIAVNDLNYEFQYNVNEGDTNRDIQERLARLITNANIGLTADVLENGTGGSALQLQSNKTGLPLTKNKIFDVSDDRTSKTAGSISAFGIDHITTPASNAEFTVNGIPHSSFSNHFTLEKTYELELTGISEENAPATIGLKTDTESLAENIAVVIGSYNNFLRTAAEYIDSQSNSNRLVHEVRSVASLHSNTLEPLGLALQQDGSIALDDNLLQQTISEDGIPDLLSSMKDFTASILRKTNQVTLNPMDYVNRKIVAYKNPGHNFANPYITSAYSGMMFNSYC